MSARRRRGRHVANVVNLARHKDDGRRSWGQIFRILSENMSEDDMDEWIAEAQAMVERKRQAIGAGAIVVALPRRPVP